VCACVCVCVCACECACDTRARPIFPIRPRRPVGLSTPHYYTCTVTPERSLPAPPTASPRATPRATPQATNLQSALLLAVEHWCGFFEHAQLAEAVRIPVGIHIQDIARRIHKSPVGRQVLQARACSHHVTQVTPATLRPTKGTCLHPQFSSLLHLHHHHHHLLLLLSLLLPRPLP
jgi:hypothetical protein